MKNKVILSVLSVLFVSALMNCCIAQTSTKTLLYLYTPYCGYCKKFDVIYDKIVGIFGNKCNFKKVDASTIEGQKLMQEYDGVFVPYVLFIDKKTNYKAFLAPNCLLSYSCTNNAVENFVKK